MCALTASISRRKGSTLSSPNAATIANRCQGTLCQVVSICGLTTFALASATAAANGAASRLMDSRVILMRSSLAAR